jgi:transcriptional regulator with XRE-family HTH domain
MESGAQILRQARQEAGLSQTQLAARLGVSQAAVSKLERPTANPTVATLQTALRALGKRLTLNVEPITGAIDETLLAAQLRLTPQQRLEQLEALYAWSLELEAAGARSRERPH